MRKRIAAGFSVLALVVTVGSWALMPGVASAASSIAQLCDANQELGFATQGQCVSYVQVVLLGGKPQIEMLCRQLISSGGGGFQFTSVSQCVPFLSHLR
jgi:hypothetical protein